MNALEQRFSSGRVADVLGAIDTVCSWNYVGVEAPLKHTATVLKMLVLAVAPFYAHGPQHVYVGPSKRGGMYARFFDKSGDEIIVFAHNDGRLFCAADGASEYTTVDRVIEIVQEACLYAALV